MQTLIEKINETLLERYTKTALNTINWSNWEEEDGTYYKLGDVYFNKLEWLKEHIEDEEMLDIINDLQETIVPILNELDK
jgi:hypothetical protein